MLHQKYIQNHRWNWVDDCDEDIKDALRIKHEAHRCMLSLRTPESERDFREARKVAQRKTRYARAKWWSDKAAALNKMSKNHDNKFFQKIKELRFSWTPGRRSGIRAIRDKNGKALADSDDISRRWVEHFKGILMIPSTVSPNVTQSLPQKPVLHELAEPPTIQEFNAALSSLKNGKAPGADLITAEMLRAGGSNLAGRLHAFFISVWISGLIPSEWRDAIFIPIPKKGDLSVCDNYRGIALLSIVGKLFAKIILARLDHSFDAHLIESQCGFRQGRSCNDMIFVARQILEKGREHQTPTFFTFVDLKKAYQSINRALCWTDLKKIGVPINV
ncbi:MAG: reverse transcriptase family protein, partial [Terriglobales bacterium]